MATIPVRELKIGVIIDKTFGVLEHSARAALLYVAALSAVTISFTYYTLEMTAVKQQLIGAGVTFLVGIIAGYLVLEAMLRATGLRTRDGDAVFFSYLGLTILSTLGVMLGFILIVLPGIFLMIRWMMAPAILVGRGVSPTKALGESWERTRGNEFSIFGAAFTILIAMIIIRIVSSALFDDKNLVGIIVTQIAANTTSLVIQAMGVALYGMIGGAQPVAPAAA